MSVPFRTADFGKTFSATHFSRAAKCFSVVRKFSPTSTKYHYTAFFYKTQPFKPKIFHFLRLYMNKFFLFSQKAVPEFTKNPFPCRKIKRQKTEISGFYATLRRFFLCFFSREKRDLKNSFSVSRFLYNSTNAAIRSAIRTHQIRIPHHTSNGIKFTE